MGLSVEVNSANFAEEVTKASYEKPVLVDFFATWCGPCQLLKPMLEKLAPEYDFIVAKIDIDKNPDLATAYGVEGVPDVRVVIQGEMMPGFVGALPEAQLREFLAKLNLKSQLEQKLEAIRGAIHSQQYEQAKIGFDHLFEQYPNHPAVTLEAVKFLIKLNNLESAEQLLNTIPPENREFYPKAQALRQFIQLQQSSHQANSHELDAKFAQACDSILREDYPTALQLFFEVLTTNRKYRDDGARKAMVLVFDLLGTDHPLSKEYRKKLLSEIF